MSEGILSQAELDALLAAQAESAGPGESADRAEGPGAELTAETRDAVGEVGNISLGAAATALSKLVNRKVAITTPRVKLVRERDIENIVPREQLAIRVQFSEGLRGESIFLMRQTDAALIADLMMGGDGSGAGILSEVQLSAVAEAMNQMMGAAVTAMAGVLRERIGITPPDVRSLDLSRPEDAAVVAELEGEELVEAAFTLKIDDLVESEFIQILPLGVSKQLVSRFYELTLLGTEEAAASALSRPATAGEPPKPAAEVDRPGTAGEERGGFNMVGEYGPKNAVMVQPAQFAPLTGQPTVRQNPNLQLLMDVQLQVTVELGRTKMLIRDILELAKGSLVELEKFAGEPVDILVNGKLVAKGEVVVIDENFGVKVVDIVTPAERIQGLQ